MRTVIFEKDGEVLATYSAPTSDDADALTRCDAFFDKYPEHDPRLKDAGLTVRVELTEQQ